MESRLLSSHTDANNTEAACVGHCGDCYSVLPGEKCDLDSISCFDSFGVVYRYDVGVTLYLLLNVERVVKNW